MDWWVWALIIVVIVVVVPIKLKILKKIFTKKEEEPEDE